MENNSNKDALDFNEHVDPVYKKGFEHGYWLQLGNSPDLKDVMRGSAKHAGYYSGLKAGQQEAQREHFRRRMENLDKGQEKNNDKGQDRGLEL